MIGSILSLVQPSGNCTEMSGSHRCAGVTMNFSEEKTIEFIFFTLQVRSQDTMSCNDLIRECVLHARTAMLFDTSRLA